MNPTWTHAGAEADSTRGRVAVYFDGKSNRRRQVALEFKDQLEIYQPSESRTDWSYADIRRVDGPSGVLRVRCMAGPVLARLEIRDSATAAELAAHCIWLEEKSRGRQGIGSIVGWSLAAAVSIIAVILLALPFAADRIAPLVPQTLERRIGDVAEEQIKSMFGGKLCQSAAGQAAWLKLVGLVEDAAALNLSIQTGVLSTSVTNAFALPGGKIYVLRGLLDKAENPDEIAGILAHELGHVKHRDSMRNLIYTGTVSFLIGLLFGDLTGSSAVIFASRSLVTASYSREAEQNADVFAIEVMHALGRPTKPMGELLFRLTGKQEDEGLSILGSHPLTEDRLRQMSEAERTPTREPLLTSQEWAALKAICGLRR